MHFNTELLKDGMVLRVEGFSTLSRMIKAVLYGSDKRYFKRIFSVLYSLKASDEFRASHDALIRQYAGVWMACDSILGQKAHYTTLTEYEGKVNRGECRVRVSIPRDVEPEDGVLAGEWWHRNVLNSTYDSRGIFNLGIKWVFPAWAIRSWEWAWWCTEGCRDSYLRGAGVQLWLKTDPTPFTTGKRTHGPGFTTFDDVTNAVIIP